MKLIKPARQLIKPTRRKFLIGGLSLLAMPAIVRAQIISDEGIFGPTVSGFDPASLFPANGGYWNITRSVAEGKIWKDSGMSSVASADGDPVGAIWDYSGNTNHLLQSTNGARPTLKNDVANNSWYVLTDGSATFIQATFTLTQPFTRINAMQQIAWTNGHVIFDGGTNTTQLFQNSSSPEITMYAGTSAPSDTTHCTVGANHVTSEIFNHAGGATASSLTVDNNIANTGDPNTHDPGGATIGTRYTSSAGQYTNIRWYDGIWIAGVMSGPNMASCRTFSGNLCGVSL